MKKEMILGKFQATGKFGFVIPDERSYFGGDFYVHKNNFKDAKDGDRVEAIELENSKGKKPEAKIFRVIKPNESHKNKDVKQVVEGIYSSGAGDFGFVDVEGQEKGFFCYGNKKSGAKDGDTVKAKIVDYNGKKEAVVLEILEKDETLIDGTFRDNEKFGFVLPFDNSPDVFVADHRKNGAREGDKVGVLIIQGKGKNLEGVIRKIY